MSNASDSLRKLTSIFESTPYPGGLAGILSAVLTVCAEENLHLSWHAHELHVKDASGNESVIKTEMRVSLFRAILARVASIHEPDTADVINPYLGTGFLRVGGVAPALLKIRFTNTPQLQRLDISPTEQITNQIDTPAEYKNRCARTQHSDFEIS